MTCVNSTKKYTHCCVNKMRFYNDKMKIFIKNQLTLLPYASNVSEDTLEEISYMVKTEYYQSNQVVFREGDPTTRVFFVTMGEVDLFSQFGDKEIIIDSLYQGCWIGAYKVLTGDKHSFTMRAKSNLTLHYISKDNISILQNGYFDLGKSISETLTYIDKTKEPIVDFFCFKPFTELSSTKLFKLKIVKLISWIRKIKELNLEGNDLTIDEFMDKITVQNSRKKALNIGNSRNSEFEKNTSLMMTRILTRMDNIQSLMATHEQGIQDLKSEIRSQAFSDCGRDEEDKDSKEYQHPDSHKKYKNQTRQPLLEENPNPSTKKHQSSKKVDSLHKIPYIEI